MTNKPKVICIGWHKTGTTTLGDALLILGYEVLGARLDMAAHLTAGEFGEVLRTASPFEALQDVPWNAMYRQLDEAFPGSKFILTVREEEQWLQSAQRHFGNSYSPMRQWLYGAGVLEGNEELYRRRFQRHYREVRTYFSGREEDLLVMELAKGDAWEKLCAFLHQPVPNQSFPHSNKGSHSLNRTERWLHQFKAFIPLPLRQLRLKILHRLGRPDPRKRFNNRAANEGVRAELRKNEQS